jgi:hypothetical protein
LLHLAQIGLRLDQQEIDAPVNKSRGLLPVRGKGILESHAPIGCESNPERTHRAGDEAGSSGSRETAGGAIEIADPIGEPVWIQPKSIAPEGVRENHIGAGLNERSMDLEHTIGIVRVK